MDVNLSIHDLSMEDLEYLQNHPYLAEYRDVQSKIQKEINDRKQGLSFCPADHTIFVYHGFHRVENVETTNTVSLRTTEGKPYQLTLDVLNIEGHHFYATYCGNLPQSTSLLARLLPVEILNSDSNYTWVDKVSEYGIYRPRNSRKRKFLRSLIAYSIYTVHELNFLISRFVENTSNNSYTLSCASEDKKYISNLPKPKIDDLLQKLDEVKEAKQIVTKTTNQQENCRKLDVFQKQQKIFKQMQKQETEMLDFVVDKNGVFDYSPSKHIVVFGVSKKKIKTYKQYTMRFLSNSYTVSSIPVYFDPANHWFIVTENDLSQHQTALIKLRHINSKKDPTLTILKKCGYCGEDGYVQHSSFVRKRVLYDLMQFHLTDRDTLISCLEKELHKRNLFPHKNVEDDIAYLKECNVISFNRPLEGSLKDFQRDECYNYNMTLSRLIDVANQVNSACSNSENRKSSRKSRKASSKEENTKQLAGLKSWLLYVKTDIDHSPIIIVEDVEEQNTANNIYWEGRNLAQGILTAIAKSSKKFSYKAYKGRNWIDEKCGSIQSIRESDLFIQKYQPALEHFANTDELPVVYVFSQKTITSFEKYSMVTVFVRNCWTHKLNPFNVYYSEEKDMYFINKSSYDAYREKYGLPFLRLIPGEYSEKNYDLRTESQLHIYGYSLEHGNTKARRQEILAFLIDSGIMKKSQIQNHIEWLINTHRDSLHYENACEKWRDDLLFTNEYKIATQRKVLAKRFCC